jgi:hypothetical protein
LAREFGSRNANLAQFFRKMLTGVDGSAGHDGLSSMIIDDLHVHRAGRSFRPPKADQPLIVDANRKLSGTAALERFQPVARQCRQIGEAWRSRRISACRANPENSVTCRPGANRSVALFRLLTITI